MQYKGISYLERKLKFKEDRVNKRYKFYEMKVLAKDFGISTPPNLRNWQNTLGWCGKAVDSLADRLIFREFANDNFNINEIFAMNNPDVLYDSAILGALISSCNFIYISEDEDGFPRLQVIDGGNATGEIDPITGLLTEGLAILKRDSYGMPISKAYFTCEATYIFNSGDKEALVFPNKVGKPLLVPIIYRPDAKRPFGHSRISRSCMDLTEAAIRTMKRSEISAEFFSVPQKWVVGLSEDVEIRDKWSAAMSTMLSITKDSDGDSPTFGQFQQQSMAPHNEQLRTIASMMAGETGLTLDDLGFSTGNPASAEAIKASHENLRLAAVKAQRTFGSGLLNVGYLAACLRDGVQYKRKQFYLTQPKWEPIFTPDASMLSGIGDGAIKLNQAVPGYFGENNLRDLTGIDGNK